jgi:hypothetical protein
VVPIVLDANLGNREQGSLIQHQFATSQGTPPITWSDFSVLGPSGSQPVNAPTLSPAGELSWQISPVEAVGSYHFDVTATNSLWSDRGHLIVDVVADPPAHGAPVVVDTDLGSVEGGLITHQFTSIEGTPPITWAELAVIGPGGTTPINAATLSATGQLNWRAHVDDIPGFYYFDVTARNSAGSDFGHLILHLSPSIPFPEPPTWLLFATAAVVLLQRVYR